MQQAVAAFGMNNMEEFEEMFGGEVNDEVDMGQIGEAVAGLIDEGLDVEEGDEEQAIDNLD